jgi:hypothetical protein
MRAIKFVAEAHDRQRTVGYDVNLRNVDWLNLGVVDSREVIPPVFVKRMKSAPRRRE